MQTQKLGQGSWKAYKFLTTMAFGSCLALLSVTYEVYKHSKHLSPTLMKWWLGLAIGTWVLFKLRRWFGRRCVRFYDLTVIGNIARNNLDIPKKDRGRFARVKTRYE